MADPLLPVGVAHSYLSDYTLPTAVEGLQRYAVGALLREAFTPHAGEHVDNAAQVLS